MFHDRFSYGSKIEWSLEGSGSRFDAEYVWRTEFVQRRLRLDSSGIFRDDLFSPSGEFPRQEYLPFVGPVCRQIPHTRELQRGAKRYPKNLAN